VKENEPHTFYTALALNALIQYARVASQTGCIVSPAITEAIDDGVSYIWSEAARVKDKFLWKFHKDKAYFCIASTTWAIHVLDKYNSLINRRLYDLEPTLTALRSTMSTILSEQYVEVEPGSWLKTWPVISENAPNFWYRYYTPIAAMTLFRTSIGTGQITPEAFASITNSVSWILARARDIDNQNHFIDADPDISTDALWVSAQSVMVLNKWRNAAVAMTANAHKQR
jgi:hypothetical protein